MARRSVVGPVSPPGVPYSGTNLSSRACREISRSLDHPLPFFNHGWHNGRVLGVQSTKDISIALASYEHTYYGAYQIGTKGVNSISGRISGKASPKLSLFQEYTDFWEASFSYAIAYVGLSVGLHPVQLADFVVGFAGVDISNDDNARTSGLKLNSPDARQLRELMLIQRQVSKE